MCRNPHSYQPGNSNRLLIVRASLLFLVQPIPHLTGAANGVASRLTMCLKTRLQMQRFRVKLLTPRSDKQRKEEETGVGSTLLLGPKYRK
jgi:hypothetical protein